MPKGALRTSPSECLKRHREKAPKYGCRDCPYATARDAATLRRHLKLIHDVQWPVVDKSYQVPRTGNVAESVRDDECPKNPFEHSSSPVDCLSEECSDSSSKLMLLSSSDEESKESSDWHYDPPAEIDSCFHRQVLGDRNPEMFHREEDPNFEEFRPRASPLSPIDWNQAMGEAPTGTIFS